MACLIVRKRETSPISKAQVSAVIGPTPGTVLSLLILSVSNGSRSRELIKAYSVSPTALDRLPAQLQQRPYARMNLLVRGEQFTEITHLVQPLFVVLHACLHQQAGDPVLHLHHLPHQQMPVPQRAASVSDLGRHHARALRKEITSQAVGDLAGMSIRSSLFFAAAIARSING